jgi:signal transduction histidine kinase
MQKFAEDTRYCVKRTTQVLDKMLKYAKSGTEELEKSLLDIAPLIKEIVQLSATELQRRNIQLQTQFEPVAQVCVDETGLYQLVLNLLLNAIDAIEENGTITIDIREEAFMQQASMVNGVCITIKDTGCGISAENLQKLCEPFYTTKYSGQDQQHLGLGLSIALKIISEHQGLLDIESELGKGSTFKIHLPI